MTDMDLQTSKYLSKKQQQFLSQLQAVSSSIQQIEVSSIQKISDTRLENYNRIKKNTLYYNAIRGITNRSDPSNEFTQAGYDTVSRLIKHGNPKAYMQLRESMRKFDIEKKQYDDDAQKQIERTQFDENLQQESSYFEWLNLLDDDIQKLQLQFEKQERIDEKALDEFVKHLSNKSKYVKHIDQFAGLSSKLDQIGESIRAKHYKSSRLSMKKLLLGFKKLRHKLWQLTKSITSTIIKFASGVLKYVSGTDEDLTEASPPKPQHSQTGRQRANSEAPSYHDDFSHSGAVPEQVLPKDTRVSQDNPPIGALLRNSIHSPPRANTSASSDAPAPETNITTSSDTPDTQETTSLGVRHTLVTWLIIISTTLLPIVVDIMDFIDCDCGILV